MYTKFGPPGQRFIAVIEAYLDESGTDATAPIVGVGGFFGSHQQWSIFLDRWEPVLLGNKFHAKDSTRMFPILVDAIKKAKLEGILVTVAKDIYKKTATPQMKSVIGNEYSVCAFQCALQICDEVDNCPTSFVIERGQPNEDFVKRILESFIGDHKYHVAAVATAAKEDFVQLHTGDFLSHIASTHDILWMKRLFNAGRLKHLHVTEQQIAETCPKVKELLGKARWLRNKAKDSLVSV